MSATIIPFPSANAEVGLTYVVVVDGVAYTYRQGPGEAEPTLLHHVPDLAEAIEFGRDVAKVNRDRFAVDFGVPPRTGGAR